VSDIRHNSAANISTYCRRATGPSNVCVIGSVFRESMWKNGRRPVWLQAAVRRPREIRKKLGVAELYRTGDGCAPRRPPLSAPCSCRPFESLKKARMRLSVDETGNTLHRWTTRMSVQQRHCEKDVCIYRIIPGPIPYGLPGAHFEIKR
jgi:hypothetical protein